MHDFFKSFRFKAILVLLAFLIGVMIFAVTKGGYSLSGASVVNTVTKPFKKLSNTVAVKIEANLDKITNATEYYNENQRLREEIGRLNSKLSDFQDTKAELEELRKFIGIKEKHEDIILSEPCKVIGFTANDPFKSFIIDKGSDNGIEPYCPVVTAEGLVGITIEVSADTSVVRTILSPDLSVGAVSTTSGDTGIVEGSISLAIDNNTKLIHVSKENNLDLGHLITTTDKSGLFPKGYSIGTVIETGVDSSGLSSYAVIKPAVRIEKLSSVMVITDFNGKDSSYYEN
ncbi:MAG: rod shape-determining protein MreC [Ruminococcus sp.]|nr:rod shape-determining protein MreC [Ruminococcus sp.]